MPEEEPDIRRIISLLIEALRKSGKVHVIGVWDHGRFEPSDAADRIDEPDGEH